MATVTTNFNFPIPQSTDLVKDGATAIASLGTSIDTQFVDLKGGTTGQILAKASNTDLDYSWITNDVGDITAVTAGTGITGGGTSGAVTVSFDQANFGGAQGAAGKNRLINGNFDIWQRGTSFTSVPGTGVPYSADRWSTSYAGTTINLTITQDTSVPNANSEYSIKYQQVTTGATSITEFVTRQTIEQSNLLPLLGKSCIVSFWYRSNKTGTHGLRIIGTPNTGGTDQTTSFTVSVADTWEYKTVAVTAFSAVSASSAAFTAAGGYVDIGFKAGNAGPGFTTLSANDYFQVSQVQLEVGSVATPFARVGGTIQNELAACQRYFAKSYSQATAPATNSSANGLVFAQSGATIASTDYICNVPLPVTMRNPPTVTIYSFTSSTTGKVSDGSGTDLAAGSGATNLINDSRFTVQNNAGVSITAAKNGVVFHYTVSAEL